MPEQGTIGFTDIVGFTEFTATSGDQAALDVLEIQAGIVGDVLPPAAQVVKELGDGLMLWFSDAADAVDSAVQLQERFAKTVVDEIFPLWVRIGLHWGQPTRRGGDLIGHDVNVAARIVDEAAPGEILLSEPVLVNVGDRCPEIRVEEVGPVLMKGLPDAVWLFRVTTHF